MSQSIAFKNFIESIIQFQYQPFPEWVDPTLFHIHLVTILEVVIQQRLNAVKTQGSGLRWNGTQFLLEIPAILPICPKSLTIHADIEVVIPNEILMEIGVDFSQLNIQPVPMPTIQLPQPPKKRSPYILFGIECRRKYADAFSHMKQLDIVQFISEQWAELDSPTKKRFVQAAAKEKMKYDQWMSKNRVF